MMMVPIVLFEQSCDVCPAGRAVLNSPSNMISVDWGDGDGPEPGPIAGAEGLGSEFFLDNQNRLIGLDLDIRPLDVISVLPPEVILPVRDSIRAVAAPARAAIDRPSKDAINPDAIWLSAALDLAIFWLHGAPPEDPFAFRFLAISSVAAVGLDPIDRTLRMILVESFAKEQRLFNELVSAQTRNSEFMKVLNTIHRHYFTKPDPAEFARLTKQLIHDLRDSRETEDWSDLERLADVYRRDLEVFVRMAVARSDRKSPS